MASIEQSWEQITQWLQTHLPEALNNLAPSASEREIETAEHCLGLSMPEALKTLYRKHNGEIHDWGPNVFDDAHWFLPLSQAIAHSQALQAFTSEAVQDEYAAWKANIEDGIICVKGPVKPHLHNPRWWPLTSSNGDVFRYLDFDPAPGGTPGQVIEYYPEACSHQVLATSLETYLADYAKKLYAGEYLIEAGAINARVVEDETTWVMPDYLAAMTFDYLQQEAVTPPIDLVSLEDGEQVELVGQVVTLMGSLGETYFVLEVEDGKAYRILSSRKETKGYGAIAIDQYACVIAIRYTKETNVFSQYFGVEKPELFAVNYSIH